MRGLKRNSSKNSDKNYELLPDEIITFPYLEEGDDQNTTSFGTLGSECIGNAKQGRISRFSRNVKNDFLNFSWKEQLPVLLLLCCMAIYLSTRLIGLRQYPVYFFTDEAVQTLLAEDLVNKQFIGNDDVFLPTFFYNGYQYNLGTSVYLQVIPYMLFGRVLEVNRGVSVLATSLTAIFLYLTAKKIYQVKTPWLIVLLLSIIPVWFLHSRTAFETSLAVMFYSGFIYYYFSYRRGERKHIFMAVMMAALTFYTYSPVRFVILASALVFFLIDLRYHFRNPKQIGIAFGFALILAIPMIRFQLQHPGANLEHLTLLGSYWIQDISIFEKLKIFFQQYFSSFSMDFWFFPDDSILSRHRMGQYPLIPTWYLLFLLVGLILIFKHWKDVSNRDLLLVLLMTPIGGSVVERGVTRMLVMVIPCVLLVMIGINWIQGWIENKNKKSGVIITAVFAVFLCGFNIYLLLDALENGALWESDYGMTGLQWGAVQLSEKIPEFMEDNPEHVQIMLTPTWANGTDNMMRFFLGTPLPFVMGNIDTFLVNYVPIPDDLVLIMIQPEYDNMIASGKFDHIKIVDEIPYPNGQPGFLFVKFQYVDNIEEIFAEEEAERSVLQVGVLEVNGVPAEVSYSYLDMGQLSDLFDHDDQSITRTFEANPMLVQVHYDVPVDLRQCTARIGGVSSHVELALYDEDRQLIKEYKLDKPEEAAPRVVDFEIQPTTGVSYANLSVENAGELEPAHVHLWEFTCTPQGE